MEQPPLNLNMSDLLLQGLQVGCGIDEDSARALASAVIEWGAEHGHAGDRYYWPCRFREFTPAERQAAIRKDFSGRNLKEVCARYGVCSRTVYLALNNR